MAAGEPKRGRQRLRRVAGLGAVLVLLLLAGALAALHLPAVQLALFDRAVAAVEDRTGLRVGADAVRLKPLGIRLELTRPSVAAGAAAPFLTADSLVVELAPGALVRRPLTVRRVVLAAPRLDGSGPLPEPPEAAGEPVGPPAVDIEEFQVHDGAVSGFEPPPALRPLLGRVSVEGVEIRGSLRDAQLALGWRITRVAALPEGLPPLAAELEGDLAGPIGGPLLLERLALEGDAVSASARGTLGLDGKQPLAVEFEVAADLPRLVGVEAAGDPLRLAGEVDLRRAAGELRLEARGLPAELARRWLEPEVVETARLAGSRMAVSGTLSFGEGVFDGAVRARWTRGPEVLAAATFASNGELAAAEVPIEVELEALPGAPGERRVETRLLLPRADPAAARLEGGRLRLDLPDLEAEGRRLRRLWPGSVPELPPGLARGPLQARGRFGGPLGDPVLRLDGKWSPVSGAAVRLSAQGSIPARKLDARLTVEGFPASRLAEGIEGAVGGSAELRLAGARATGELSLSGDGLGWDGTSFERASLSAVFDGRSLRVRELVVSSAGRHLRAAGEIDLSDLPGADLELELTAEAGPVTAAAGRLRLLDGSLRLEVPTADLAGVEASLSATAPLVTLAELPGAEALARLPLSGPGGPLEIEWSQPAIDWAKVVGPARAGTPEGEATSRWVVGSRGRLVLDPSAPTTAVGEVVLFDLALEQGGHLVRSPAPLRLELTGGRLELVAAAVELDGHPVELAGTARLRPEWRPGLPPEELVEEARVTAHTRGAEPVDLADLALTLRGGRIELDVTAQMADGGRGRLAASGPLAALTSGGGTLEASWRIPAADWSGWLPAPADEAQALRRLMAGTAGSLRVDPSRPALGSGELRVEGFAAEVGDQSVRAREPIALRLAEGRLRVESARLLASGAPLELSGWVELDAGWRPGSPMTELVSEVMLTGGGVVPAAMLNPFLAGGAGEGALQAELEVTGLRESARGELRLTGSGAGFFFASPYALEVLEPEVTLRLVAGEATFEGSARVNEGRLTFSGGADEQAGIDLEARLSEVRAVLDYGLLTLLDGSLRLTLAPDGKGLLAGTLTVDRGQLTRSLRLDSLLLDQLLPADLLSTELDPLEGVGLDLTLVTRQGVRVKNNLADLKVRWQPISVRGNLVRPIIEGRLEVDPGGLVHAYGQTVRLDSAAVVYRGLPEEVPELELQTTTSLEDPSIARLAGDDPFADRQAARDADADADEGEGGAAGAALTTGLASFLGERFNSSVGEVLGGTRISFRSPLIFGEADPGARLTAASDLSARATVAASVDLRNAERQTYLLDLHDEDAAARLSAQLFTNDLGNEGGTLQQRLEFGGGGRRHDGPRVRRLKIDPVPGVRRRALKRAVGHRKGDRLPEGGGFEAAVAVGELLRDRGYPDARVRVRQEAATGRSGVVLEVGIDSGPRVEFQFTGESLPKPLRRAVAQLYRGDFYEPTAIEEMRLEAVRAWRSRGYLDPRVTIGRELLPGGPPERRRVTIDSAPGDRVDLEPPRFVGLPDPEAAELTSLFAGTLRRAELAAGLEAAQRRALDGLAALGYPDATIRGRRLSPDRRQLTVEVEPGERLRVTSLELADTSGRRTEVGEAGGIAAGAPARVDRLSRAALEVEQQLRDAGYLDAEVGLTIEPLGADRPAERRVVFALDRGPLYRLGTIEFEGLAATRPGWARRTAGLEEGRPLAPAALRDARRRLFGTGLFAAVGSGVGGAETGAARVLFEVQEEPRYRVAYGMRWESEEGASVVVDLLDRNLLGRGIDLGLRTLWSDDLRQLRLSASFPGVLGPKSRLDLFGLAGEEERLDELGEPEEETLVEGTVQLGWQLGVRTTGRIYGRFRSARVVFQDPFFGPSVLKTERPFLGLQYIFDSRNDRASPRSGLFASFDLSFSDESLGSDIRYGRLFGQLHSFRPAGRLAGRDLTWAQSVRLGHAEAFSGQELLDELLLRAGGEYSVRGYLRETLGPAALTGSRAPSTEQNSLFVLNQELRFEIRDPLSGLVFFDAGNVWIDDGSEFDLFTSVGLGLRAGTPFGLLRLDLAVPLDRREGVDPEVKLYFGLGNVF